MPTFPRLSAGRLSSLLSLMVIAPLASCANSGNGSSGAAVRHGETVTITDLGAKGDGKTLCSDAIKSAIEQLAAKGGGTVRVPAGTFLTGPIWLKSNITLQIDEGATLLFSTDRSLYPLVKSRYECTDMMNYSPLIYAYQQHDIAITGKGTIDGQGAEWWKWAHVEFKGASAELKHYTQDAKGEYPIEQRVFGDKHPGLRPCFVEPYECKNVLIEGITIKQSPFWNIHPLYSDHVTVSGVTVFGSGPNTDGCDPDSTTNVLIENCKFTTGDDCIAIKSGRDADGIRVNRPTENVTIRHCLMTGGHGGITIGSETSGSVRHVLAEDNVLDGPDSGIRIKSTRGRGGVVEDIVCRRILIKSVKKVAITLDLRYSNAKDTAVYAKDATTPIFRDIHLEDVTATSGPQAMYVIGLAEAPIENFTLKNVTLNTVKGAYVELVNGFGRENVNVTAEKGDAWTLKDVVVTGAK